MVTAPDELRSTVRRLGIAALIATVSQWRPGTCPDTPLAATRFAMKSTALRYKQLSAEILTLDLQLDRLVTEAAPSLLALKGVGTEIAASLLIVSRRSAVPWRSCRPHLVKYTAQEQASEEGVKTGQGYP